MTTKEISNWKKYTINYGSGIAYLTTCVPFDRVEDRFMNLANTCFGIRKSIMGVIIMDFTRISHSEFEKLEFGGDAYIWKEDGSRKMILPDEDENWETYYCKECRRDQFEKAKFRPMTLEEYQKEALQMERPKVSSIDFNKIMKLFSVLGIPNNIDESISLPRLSEGLMGLNGESGEAIDILKKALFQGHKLDREHLARELGDVAWYLVQAADSIGYSFEDICKMNIKKLKERYPDGFDMNKSIHRDSSDI